MKSALHAAFGRARAMFGAILSVLHNNLFATWDNAVGLSGIGNYRSRGKGKGRIGAKMHCAAQDQCAARKKRNRLAHRKACR